MLRKMPFLLLSLILGVVVFDPLLSVDVKEILYAVSLSIKSLILFVLPFIIFSLLFKTAVNLAYKATGVIAFILLAVCCSNFVATFLAHYVGEVVYHMDLSVMAASPLGTTELTPAWEWSLGRLWANDRAMFAGILFGIVGSFFARGLAQRVGCALEWAVNQLLRSFTYLIPLFVTGFVVKLQFDGAISMILKDYLWIFLLIALAQLTYILTTYWILNGGQLVPTVQSLKNMLPAWISGFTTMSSAATMPLTIVGVESNTRDKELASAVVPATVNIHLLGDCFGIPILAYAVMKTYGVAEPSLWTYLVFTAYFVLAKFSVAAVPGGGILVMLPILEEYLGFSAPMMSLITALYILFDPVMTSANVLGNGAFAQMVDRVVRWAKGRLKNHSLRATTGLR